MAAETAPGATELELEVEGRENELSDEAITREMVTSGTFSLA